MARSDLSNKIIAVAIAVLVLLAPSIFIATILSFLVFTGDLVLRRVTLIEVVELYLIELVLTAAFAYGLYRLLLYLFEHQLPASLDALELNAEKEETGTSDDRDRGDR